MRSRRTFTFITGVLIAIAASATFAHHGWSGYKQVLEMTMIVSELKLGNPHDRLIATDDSGQEWNLLLAPPARNRRFGFSEESISVGDEVQRVSTSSPEETPVIVVSVTADTVELAEAAAPLAIELYIEQRAQTEIDKLESGAAVSGGVAATTSAGSVAAGADASTASGARVLSTTSGRAGSTRAPSAAASLTSG